jgi:RNA polymerase sigma-70 factor, ECF subfamily
LSEFHRLIEQQIPRLRRYARALTRNRERADDLVQDTLRRALIKEQFWQPDTNLRAWLFTIMHNQNVNNIRRDTLFFASFWKWRNAVLRQLCRRQLDARNRGMG